MRVFVLSALETCVNGASHGSIDVVVGRSVIFSSRARGTAPHRAFFMMWVSVDKWIRCELPTGGLGQNQNGLRTAPRKELRTLLLIPLLSGERAQFEPRRAPLATRRGLSRVRGVQGRRLDRRSAL